MNKLRGVERVAVHGSRALTLLVYAALLRSTVSLGASTPDPSSRQTISLLPQSAVIGKQELVVADERELRSLRPPLLHLQVTSPYGERLNPVMRKMVFHRGVDYGAASGTPVYAAQNGVVEVAGLRDKAGIYVRIRHNARVETIYAHLHRIMPGLRVGSILRAGDILGFVGASGFTTGPHLHYEVLLSGKPINPELCCYPIEQVSSNER